ncbi:hypothetical protein ACOSP7_002295 [Xanthoceras sorbifolium]
MVGEEQLQNEEVSSGGNSYNSLHTNGGEQVPELSGGLRSTIKEASNVLVNVITASPIILDLVGNRINPVTDQTDFNAANGFTSESSIEDVEAQLKVADSNMAYQDFGSTNAKGPSGENMKHKWLRWVRSRIFAE